MSKNPYTDRDIVRFLQYVIDNGSADHNGMHIIDMGGVIIKGRIYDPFKLNPPMGRLYTSEWGLSFYLPKDYPVHITALQYDHDQEKPVCIHSVRITGDDSALLRDMTFAKLLL